MQKPSETPTAACPIMPVLNEVAVPIKQTTLTGGLIDNVDIIAVPRDYDLKSLQAFMEPLLPRPPRRKGISNHTAPISLINHMTRYKSDTTVLFVNQEIEKVTAVYNYNPEGGDAEDALYGDHAACLSLKRSDELKEWRAFCAEPVSAEALAFFLEKRGVDLIAEDDAPPTHKARLDRIKLIGGLIATPHQVISTIPALKIMETSEVQNAKNIATGECSLVYKSDHTAMNAGGEKITIPGWFLIAVPIYRNGPLDLIPVRLRYRKKQSAIFWSLDLIDIEKYIAQSFEQFVETIAKEFNVPLFYGEQEK